jgi:hypothetical protein
LAGEQASQHRQTIADGATIHRYGMDSAAILLQMFHLSRLITPHKGN